MKSLTAITIISVAVMIMASAGYYFYNNSINESSYPSYHVDMHLNTTIPVPYYPIHVNSNLTGNGTYQQLLTISDPSHYGINANGSNLAFYDGSNNTHLYAWIQSINKTSMQVWVKNYYASNVIDMQVLPSYKNLFNATGYLGDNTTNNAKYVFPAYNNNVSMNGHGAIAAIWVGGNSSGFVEDGFNYPYVSVSAGIPGGVYVSDIETEFLNTGIKIIPNIYNTTAIYANYGTSNSSDITSTTWLVNNFTSVQTLNITKAGDLEYVSYDAGYGNTGTTRIYYWEYGVDVPNGIMPTFTIGPAYHPLSSFSISSNSLVVNTTFTEHNLSAYQYYSFSPMYNGNPVWFLLDGQVGDRLSVLLDSNVSLTVQILGYSYSNVIKEVKVE